MDNFLHLYVYIFFKKFAWHILSFIFLMWGFSLKMRKMPLTKSLIPIFLGYFLAYFAPILWNYFMNY